MARLPLSRVNNYLLVAIIGVNLFIIIQPFWPQLEFAWQKHHSHRQQELNHRLETTSEDHSTATRPRYSANTLIMPTLLSEQVVHEGVVRDQYQVLNQGVWRYPTSSTPDKGGNTVLLAHRFTYTNPRGAFYFLDKLQVGNRIGLYWEGALHTYEVTSSQRLPATSTEILNPTSHARLTLFTCTPLWHPTDRLVVIAEEVKHD